MVPTEQTKNVLSILYQITVDTGVSLTAFLKLLLIVATLEE